jgi:hypothetical protein
MVVFPLVFVDVVVLRGRSGLAPECLLVGLL